MELIPPLVSICCPVLNELTYLPQLVSSVMAEEAGIRKELFLIDGGSQDGSRAWIENAAASNPHIKLIKNDQRYVSHGFNKAYAEASGEYIALIGAHATYSANYFSEAIRVIETRHADAAGGLLRQLGKTPTGKAIALAMSAPIGVGNTGFRTGAAAGPAESVAFAVYKRSVFDVAGLLDEELIRNQDDEFHYRMNQLGLVIYLDPTLSVTYYVRDTYSALWKQYNQYGFYKPLVLKKVRSGIKMRHLIPACFVLYLCSLPLLLVFPLWLVPLLIYLGTTFYFSLRLGGLSDAVRVLLAIFTLHIAYGSGFLRGILKFNFVN